MGKQHFGSGGSKIFEREVQVQMDYCNSTRSYIMLDRGRRSTLVKWRLRVIHLCRGYEAVDYPCEAWKF